MKRSKWWDVLKLMLGVIATAVFAYLYLDGESRGVTHWFLLIVTALNLFVLAGDFVSLLRRS